MHDALASLHLRAEPMAPADSFARQLLTRVATELALPARLPITPERLVAPPPESYDVLDDALEVLAGTAPEYDPYGLGFCLTNHAPMVIETMCALGRPDAVMPWVANFRRHLSDAEAPRDEIVPADWRKALGRLGRAPDWTVLFTRALDQVPWRVVLNEWIPRLAPGSYAVHGLLRTAHAVRALGVRETDARRAEFAEALAYWAASYEALPYRPHSSARLAPDEALQRVELIDAEAREQWMQFTQPVEQAAALSSFLDVTDLVAVDDDPSRVLSALSEVMAQVVAANAFTGPTSRGIVHCLTAGTATRLMLPHLDTAATRVSLRFGWQVAAAFYAGLAVDPPLGDTVLPDVTLDELIDLALHCPDEHGVKITEACLREYALNPQPVYLVAAYRSTKDLYDTGLKLA